MLYPISSFLQVLLLTLPERTGHFRLWSRATHPLTKLFILSDNTGVSVLLYYTFVLQNQSFRVFIPFTNLWLSENCMKCRGKPVEILTLKLCFFVLSDWKIRWQVVLKFESWRWQAQIQPCGAFLEYEYLNYKFTTK